MWQIELRNELWHLPQSSYSSGGMLYKAAVETLNEMEVANKSGITPSWSSSTTWENLPVVWEDIKRAVKHLGEAVYTYEAEHETEEIVYNIQRWDFKQLQLDVADHRVEAQERKIAEMHDEGLQAQRITARFIANTSHDIRTPITAVIGFVELMRDGAYGDMDETQNQVLANILNAAENLLEIINNLLDTLSLKSGSLHLQIKKVNLNDLLSTLHTILRPLSERRKISLDIVLPAEPIIIDADINIVRHMVYHLLSSSLRATPSGNSVVMSVYIEGENVIIQTRDEALHLPSDATQSLSISSVTQENSPVRGYEKLDVGLPLVQHYAELHGGTLTLSSMPKVGTRFKIMLPVRRVADPDLGS